MIKNRLVFLILLGSVLLFTSYGKAKGEPPATNDFVVVLDAGHGGHDPGNLGNGYLEKNIALAIVLYTGELLEARGIKVIYTRKDDTFIGLGERGAIANKAKANLFISVHCDSHTSNAYGAGTFVLGLHRNKENFEIAKKENSVIYLEDNYEDKYAEYDINSPESIIGLTIMQEEFLEQSIALAKLMQNNFSEKLKRKDRKVKQAGFVVLHQTFMPSILVEAGFLTNKTEGAYLNSTKGQKEIAKAIANAIIAYKDGVDSNTIAYDAPTPEPAKPNTTVSSLPEVTATDAAKVPKKEEETVVVETKESVTKPVAQKESPPPPVNVKNQISYKVQLMASGKTVPLKAENFNGLDILSKEPFKNLYRYMYGNVATYNEAKQLKATADEKGYTDSYIVAYKDGVRIPLGEARKSERPR